MEATTWDRLAITLRTCLGPPVGHGCYCPPVHRSTTMIYTHTLNRGGPEVRSPVDAL